MDALPPSINLWSTVKLTFTVFYILISPSTTTGLSIALFTAAKTVQFANADIKNVQLRVNGATASVNPSIPMEVTIPNPKLSLRIPTILKFKPSILVTNLTS